MLFCLRSTLYWGLPAETNRIGAGDVLAIKALANGKTQHFYSKIMKKKKKQQTRQLQRRQHTSHDTHTHTATNTLSHIRYYLLACRHRYTDIIHTSSASSSCSNDVVCISSKCRQVLLCAIYLSIYICLSVC